MPVEVIMPKVDMDMSSGKIVAWHAAPGDMVEKGTPLFDIETDKAAMEVEAPASGILQHPVDAGVDVPIGKPVAWLYAEGESVGHSGDSPKLELLATSEPAAFPLAWSEGSAASEAAEPVSSKVRATPLARKLAVESAIDLERVNGSGARGRIQASDVRAMVETRSEGTPSLQFVPQSGPLSITYSGNDTGTPILLLHGFASDATSWSPLEAHFDGHPVIRMDLPCHGRSPKRRIDSFAALVSEIRHAFDSLALPKVHLIGHSLGGALCLALADTRERAIQSLTLIAPAGLGPDINGAALDGIGKATRPASLGPWLKTLVADDSLVSGGYVRAAMAGRQDPELRAAQRLLSEVLFPDGVQAFDLKSALHRLQIPTRIIWGRQDNIIPWRHALRAPGRVALHLFDEIGHMPQIEAPGEIARMIRASL